MPKANDVSIVIKKHALSGSRLPAAHTMRRFRRCYTIFVRVGLRILFSISHCVLLFALLAQLRYNKLRTFVILPYSFILYFGTDEYCLLLLYLLILGVKKVLNVLAFFFLKRFSYRIQQFRDALLKKFPKLWCSNCQRSTINYETQNILYSADTVSTLQNKTIQYFKRNKFFALIFEAQDGAKTQELQIQILRKATVIYVLLALHNERSNGRTSIVSTRAQKKRRLKVMSEGDVRHTQQQATTITTKTTSASANNVLEHEDDDEIVYRPSTSSEGNKTLNYRRHTSISLPKLSASAEELRRVPSYLSNYRRRIEAGVEEQRRQREILEGLQDKILKCRLNNAKQQQHGSSSSSAVHKCHEASCSANCLLHDLSRCGEKGVNFKCKSCVELYDFADDDTHYAADVSMRRAAAHSRNIRPYSSSNYFASGAAFSPRRQRRKFYEFADADDALLSNHLREEEARNAFLEDVLYEMRKQLDMAFNANETLSASVVQLNAQLHNESTTRQKDANAHAEKLKRQKRFNEKLRNCLHEFWIEFCALKRRINDLSADVKSDLSLQKPELVRAGKLILRLLQQFRLDENKFEKAAGVQRERVDELLQRNNALNARNAQLEADKDENAQKFLRLDFAHRQSSEENHLLAGCLREIHKLPEMFGVASSSSAPQLKDDSSSNKFLCESALSTIKSALKSRNASIETLRKNLTQENAKRAALESKSSELEKSLEKTQRALQTSGESRATLEIEKEELIRKHSKLKQKLAESESQKSSLEVELFSTNQQLDQCRSEHEAFLADLKSAHAKVLDDMRHEIMEREEEIQRVADRSKRETQRAKCEQAAKLEAENSAMKTELSVQSKSLQEMRENLRGLNSQLNEWRSKFDAQHAELRHKSAQLAELEERMDASHVESEELRRKLTTLSEEKLAWSDKIASQTVELEHLRAELAAAMKRLGENAADLQEAITQAEKHKSEAEELRELARRHFSNFEEIRRKNSRLEEENRALDEKVTERETRIFESSSRISALREEVAYLSRECNTKAEELACALRSSRDVQAKYQLYLSRFEEAENRVASLKHEARERRETENQVKWKAKKCAKDLEIAEEKRVELAEKLRVEREMSRAEVERLEQMFEAELKRHLTSEANSQQTGGFSAADGGAIFRNATADEKDISSSTSGAFKTHYDALSDENKRLRSRLKLAENEVEELRAEHSKTGANLRAEIDALSRIQREKLSELSESHERSNATQHEFVQGLERDLGDAYARLGDGERREHSLKEQLTSAEARIERSAQAIRRLYAELEELSEQSDSQCAEREKRIERMRAELSAKSSQLENWRQRFEQQRDNCAQIEARCDAKDELAREQAQKIGALEELLLNSKDEVAQHLARNALLNSQVSSLQAECQTLRRTIANLESGAKISTKRSNEVDAQLEETLARLSKESEKLRTSEERLRKKDEEYERLNAEKTQLEFEISNSSKKLNEMAAASRRFKANEEALTEQLSAEKNKRRDLEASLASLKKASDALRAQLRTHDANNETNEKSLSELLENLRLAEREKFDALDKMSANKAQLEFYRTRLEMLTQTRDAFAVKLRQNRRKLARLNAQLEANERSAKRIADYAANKNWFSSIEQFHRLSSSLDNRDSVKAQFPRVLTNLPSNDHVDAVFVDELSSRTSFLTRETYGGRGTATTEEAMNDVGVVSPRKATPTSAQLSVSTSLHSMPPLASPNNNENAAGQEKIHASSEKAGKASDEESRSSSKAAKCGLYDNDENREVNRRQDVTSALRIGLASSSFKPVASNFFVKRRRRLRETASRKNQNNLSSHSLSSNSSSSSSSYLLENKQIPRSSKSEKPKSNKVSSILEVSFLAMQIRIAELEKTERMRLEEAERLKTELKENLKEKAELNDSLRELHENNNKLQRGNLDLEARLLNVESTAKAAHGEIHSAISDERRALRAQISAAEVRANEAESRVAHIGEQLRVKADELRAVDEERRELRSTELRLRGDCAQFEARANDTFRMLEMTRLELENARKEHEALSTRLKQSELDALELRRKCDSLEEQVNRLNEEILRLKRVRSGNASDDGAPRQRFSSKTTDVTTRQQQQNQQHANKLKLEEVSARWRAVEEEREQARRELLDVRSKLNCANVKLNNAQALNLEVSADKRRLADRVDFLEKCERQCEHLSRELEHLSAERLTLNAEVDDLKRQLQRANLERREMEVQLDRTRRENAAHKSLIENLEEEKRRIEATARNASAERLALDKSLSSMEKQNAELGRQCTQLQRQVEQMERENCVNDSRNVNATETNVKRKVEKLEAEIHRLNQTKRQLEKTIDQREQNYAQKLKMYDIQLATLNENLEWEREQQRNLRRETKVLRRPSLLQPFTSVTQNSKDRITTRKSAASSANLDGKPMVYGAGIIQKFLGDDASSSQTDSQRRYHSLQRTTTVSVEMPLAKNSATLSNNNLAPTSMKAVLHDARKNSASLHLQTASLATYIRRTQTTTSSALEPKPTEKRIDSANSHKTF